MNAGCILQNADRNSKKKPAQQSRDCCFCATGINMQRCLQMHERFKPQKSLRILCFLNPEERKNRKLY